MSSITKQNSLQPVTSTSHSPASNSSSSYLIPATLTPFFDKKKGKKDVKNIKKQENIGCFRCTFIEFLYDLCTDGKKKKNRIKKRQNMKGTQISTDQENEKFCVFNNNDEPILKEEIKTKEIIQQIEYIEESQELNSSPICIHQNSIKFPDNFSKNSTFLTKKQINYVFNSYFLYRNSFGQAIYLTKIQLKKCENHIRQSLQNFEKIEKSAFSNLKNRFISFIFQENTNFQYLETINRLLENRNNSVLLDVSSDISSLNHVFFTINF